MEISTNIKERILQIADYKNIKKGEFIEGLGQSYNNYRGKSKESPPTSEIIAEISTRYPDINLIWLLTGKGEMIQNKNTYPTKESEFYEKLLELKNKEIEMKDEMIKQLKDHIVTLKNMPEMGDSNASVG
ncbi:hypothetical protein [Bergeyella zoohelcum]|uniref:HTH cro/C1-type domain-containing protein n=1 Tax=Bergeyella zoohelcum TaxID=1015 RepID=A0A376C1P7_9FLAO|nr:hypothetical protein [Bergeyella zoohelcum]EKB60740.1 hypothetical protein HMPREF9700_00235 [Bergeyella zoohelcum CCUG 30536]SSZ47170.1 Uncharacterised protein [Bergeyella zoohelcum]